MRFSKIANLVNAPAIHNQKKRCNPRQPSPGHTSPAQSAQPAQPSPAQPASPGSKPAFKELQYILVNTIKVGYGIFAASLCSPVPVGAAPWQLLRHRPPFGACPRNLALGPSPSRAPVCDMKVGQDSNQLQFVCPLAPFIKYRFWVACAGHKCEVRP